MKKKFPVTGIPDPLVLVSKADQRTALERDVEVFLLAGGEIQVLPPSGTQDVIRRAIEGLRYERQIRLM